MGQPYQGQPGEEIDPKAVDVYRGGHDVVPKPDEYKIDPATGSVKCTHGVSLETDAAALARFGTIMRVKSVPATLRIVQRGRRPTHFEIVPRRPMSPSDYERALGQVTLEQNMATSTESTVVEAGNAKIIFDGGFDELDAFNALGAGYRGAVTVELEDGSRHAVVFYDAVRLQQDLDEEAKQGTPFIAEPGMIVLTEVTLDNMKRAVSSLDRQGYFACLKRADQV